MAHSEACQLFIEQQIKEGLTEGKTPYSIGKDLAQWIEQLFEAKISMGTLKMRAERMQQKLVTNVTNDLTTQKNNEPEEIQVEVKHGGRRDGAGRPPKAIKAKATALALFHTGDQESYTPTKYIESARLVMGGIDLDPASCEFANQWIKAETFFTKASDGLSKEWSGKVWLNPPYEYPLIKHFIDKLLSSENVTEAILLTNNNTDTLWFHFAAQKSRAICLTKGRISFAKPDQSHSQPTNGQAFFYFGKNIDAFVNEFCKYGMIIEVLRNAK